MPVGLLGPLGHLHLESAEERRMRSIAVGTRAIDALESCAAELQLGDPVLLYASHQKPVSLVVSWSGTWGGWQYAVGNGIPPKEWRRHRSELMLKEDREGGYFTAFYLVEDLHHLDEPIPLSTLRAWGKDKSLASNFIPRGPLLVHW